MPDSAQHPPTNRPHSVAALTALTQKNGPHSIFFYPNGDTYKGTWAANQKHGVGTHTTTINHVNVKYEGEFVRDKKHGQGTLHEAEKKIYEGEWKDGTKCGKGTEYYSDGNYEGMWEHNLQNGYGKRTTKEEVYEGNWVQGKKCGKGKTTYSKHFYD